MDEILTFEDQITAVITTCPLPCHPNIGDLDIVYRSISRQLPNADVLMLADGVRFEQECMRPQYNEFISRVQQRIDSGEWNARLECFDKLTHQAGTVRFALQNLITRPLVLFVEHDLPLTEFTFDWKGMVETLLDGSETICICFSHNAKSSDYTNKYNVPLIRGPHLFSTYPFFSRADFLRQLCTLYQTGLCVMEYAPLNDFLHKRGLDSKISVYAPPECAGLWHSTGTESGRHRDDGSFPPHFPMAL